MKKYALTFILICVALNSVFAQVSTLFPLKPFVTDTIAITYDTTFPNAKLKTGEAIFSRITYYLQDGSFVKTHQQLVGSNGKLGTRLLLPQQTAYTKIEFYSLNKEDESASKSLIVYDTKTLKPVKGAYLDVLFSNKPDSIFKLEIINHPTNYYAYARYMNVIAMIKDPQLAKKQISTYLTALDSITKIQPGARNDIGLLTATCVGNIKIGNMIEAKKILFQLFDRYPVASETAFAFSIYNYEYYKSSNKLIEDDVRYKIKQIFVCFPTAALQKNANIFEYLRLEKDIPTEAFENALLPQYESEELPYYALGNLPELYIQRNEKLESGKSILINAIKRFQDGSIQHQYRLNTGHYQMHVSLLLYDLAKINSLEKDNQSVIINASAAMQILLGSNVEGNFLPLLLQLRAKAFTDMGNFNLAIADYEKLYVSGSANVLDSLQRLFPLSDLKHKSFEDYLKVLKPSDKKAYSDLTTLANFSGTDLKGNKLSLSDLKGKIVVLNIWGIGCGPCIAEMPELNKLVKEFANQPNVVFIAITNDNKESLVKFFKTRKFDYKVINKVANTSTIFNTNSLPVHMVIGKNGEILNRSIGARDDIHEFLKRIIEINL